MSSRMQNAGLVALLIVTLVVVAYALRTPEPVVAAPRTPTASKSASTSASASPSESPSPTPSAANPFIGSGATVAFLGDSFAAGTGATTAAKRWTSIVATEQGWSETNVAHAQTGYTRAGRVGDCTPSTCPAYTGVVADVVAAKPALVIVTGGANDLNADKAALTAAVSKTINDLRSGIPDVKVVVINPWWDMRPLSPKLADYTAVIQAAATAAGAQWVDSGQPLVGQGALMQSDGVQANDAGHAALAASVTKALRTAGIIAP